MYFQVGLNVLFIISFINRYKISLLIVNEIIAGLPIGVKLMPKPDFL